MKQEFLYRDPNADVLRDLKLVLEIARGRHKLAVMGV